MAGLGSRSSLPLPASVDNTSHLFVYAQRAAVISTDVRNDVDASAA
jgi:hypothetical protein